MWPSFLIGFDSDVTWRTRTLSLDGEPLEDLYFAALSEETQDIFVAYSEGVNQWLDHAALGTHGAKLSEEYSSGLLYDVAQIPEWKPQHSLAPLFQLAYTYSGAIDVAVGDEAAVFDPAIISDLYATPAVVQSSVVLEAETALLQRRRSFPGERPWRRWLTPAASTLRKLGRTGDDFSSILFGDYVPGHGSNSWVVGKSATTSGGAILSNDPHLQITNPSIWYLVEMSSTEAGGDLHIAGASIPCGPGVVIGHNEHVAWGATIAYYDLADAYVETLRPDGVSVDRGGTPVELLRKEFEFNGKGSTTPRTATIEIVPGHGPIIAKDAEAKTAVAFRWVAQEPGTDVEFLPAIWRATSVDEVEAALDHVRMLNIAWTAADRTGSIGWYPKTLVPNRPWASAQMPSWLPLPGDGTAEWDGYLDAAQLPTLKDPAAGFIATTNNDFNGDWFDGDNTNDGHPPLQSLLSVGAGYRHSRVVERLRTEGPHNFDTIRDILADTHSVHGELLVPEVLLTTDTLDGLSADATAVVEALRAWRYTCPSALDGADPETAAIVSDAAVVRESAGCAAFHLFAVELTDTVFDELAAFAPQYDRHYWKDWQSTMVHLLVDPTALSYGTAYFDDVSTPAVETRSDAIRDALEAGDETRARQLLAQWQRVDASELPRSEIVRHVIEYSVLAAHRHGHRLGIAGANVTIPHKEAIVAHLDADGGQQRKHGDT
mgnify:CR=1 FL=1